MICRPHFRNATYALIAMTLTPIAASAQSTSRVSIPTGGAGQGSSESRGVSAISPDGRFVVFPSLAGLAAGDNNNAWDIYLHDRQTVETWRISMGMGGAPTNGSSVDPAMSADGRFIVYESAANNIVPNDTNNDSDIFLYDRQTGQTSRINGPQGVEPNNDSGNPAISPDGRWIAFESTATNLVPNDTNSNVDVFMYDRQSGEVSRLNVATDGTQAAGGSTLVPSMSDDGRYVAFVSFAANLVAGDTNNASDIFVRDRVAGQTTRVSVSASGVQGNSDCSRPVMSGDGHWVAFDTTSSTLVPNDTNARADVFVRDLQANTIWSPTQGGNGHSTAPSISADKRFIAFQSSATNYFPADSNGQSDVFVFDDVTGDTVCISRASATVYGNKASELPKISADGRWVVFSSLADNLVPNDLNALYDIFVRDRTGASCDEDINTDGVIGLGDVAKLIQRWGQNCP
ncbi:MAG TPA: hypothetical protein VG797_03715 [Phycisphaerales bacterium]|nr:hypothetical protein [Phycisphaerales bacterium]